MEWIGFGRNWNKCEVCWRYYERGIQHENSLNCYKVGIPITSLKVPLEEFLERVKDIPGKYALFPFPISIMSKGVIIFYFNSKEEMYSFIEKVRDYVRDEVSLRERKFYDMFVNVEWIGSINWRRGCPEYDKKFGDWRNWRVESEGK